MLVYQRVVQIASDCECGCCVEGKPQALEVVGVLVLVQENCQEI